MSIRNAFKIVKGADKAFVITLAGVGDITGQNFLFTLRNFPGDIAAPLLTRASTLVSGVGRQIQITLLAADTVNLAAGDYAYDVWRTDAGFQASASYGPFKVIQDVRNP